LGQKQQAINELKQVLNTNPEHCGALYNLALVYFEDNQLAAAKVYSNKLVETHPLNAPGQQLLGHIYLTENQLSLAETHFKKALELDSNSY